LLRYNFKILKQKHNKMDLQQLLGGSLGQEATQLISQQLGIDANQAQSAVNLALPTILSALNRNASTEDGAAASDKCHCKRS
jgi:hypothetical protein